MRLLPITIISFALLLGCGPALESTSGLAGASSDDLIADGHGDLKPQYSRLYDPETNTIKVSIFISYDKLRAGLPVGYGLTDLSQDYGSQAFDSLTSWLPGPDRIDTVDVQGLTNQQESLYQSAISNIVSEADADFQTRKEALRAKALSENWNEGQIRSEVDSLLQQVSTSRDARIAEIHQSHNESLQESVNTAAKAARVENPENFLWNSQKQVVRDDAKYKQVNITGQGRGLAGSDESMNWDIDLHLGPVCAGSFGTDPELEAKCQEFTKAYGRALAQSNVTLLNGHFYGADARAAGATPETDLYGARYALYSRDSQLYGPAMDTFQTTGATTSHNYRIAVVNGCDSDDIEDLVLNKTPRGHDTEVVSMNGYSNYKHFGKQISSMLNNLVAKEDGAEAGTSWSQVLDGFAIPEGTESVRPGKALKPVLRTATVGQGS